MSAESLCQALLALRFRPIQIKNSVLHTVGKSESASPTPHQKSAILYIERGPHPRFADRDCIRPLFELETGQASANSQP